MGGGLDTKLFWRLTRIRKISEKKKDRDAKMMVFRRVRVARIILTPFSRPGIPGGEFLFAVGLGVYGFLVDSSEKFCHASSTP